jgi:hypothetical protein
VDFLNGTRGLDFHFALEEQDTIREPFDMKHFLDRGSLEKSREKVQSLFVAMEMEVHVLVHGLKFVRHRLVQKSNAFFVHDALLYGWFPVFWPL